MLAAKVAPPRAETVSIKIELEIRPLQLGEDGSAFRTLNEEWITRHFSLEAKDRENLGDPENTILRKGGHVFIAYLRGEAVGCVALIATDERTFELSKMAVTPTLRGFGIGRALINCVIEQARRMGAASLFLGSSSRLPSAIHLYESVGFGHVPPESLPTMHYSRADIFMEMTL